MNDEEFPKDVLPFEEEIKKYIDKYVLGEDKEAQHPLFIVTIKINMT